MDSSGTWRLMLQRLCPLFIQSMSRSRSRWHTEFVCRLFYSFILSQVSEAPAELSFSVSVRLVFLEVYSNDPSEPQPLDACEGDVVETLSSCCFHFEKGRRAVRMKTWSWLWETAAVCEHLCSCLQFSRLIKPFQLWDLNEILPMPPCLLVDGGRQITPSTAHETKWGLMASQILWIQILSHNMKIVEPSFVINVELFCRHQQTELKGILKHSVLRPVSRDTTACCAASRRGRVRGHLRSARNPANIYRANQTSGEIVPERRLHAGSCLSAGLPQPSHQPQDKQTVRGVSADCQGLPVSPARAAACRS